VWRFTSFTTKTFFSSMTGSGFSGVSKRTRTHKQTSGRPLKQTNIHAETNKYKNMITETNNQTHKPSQASTSAFICRIVITVSCLLVAFLGVSF